MWGASQKRGENPKEALRPGDLYTILTKAYKLVNCKYNGKCFQASREGQ